MAATEDVLAQNLAAVRERIADAAARSGRSIHDVTLVAVTKYVDESVTRALAEVGCRTLGESRPQALWRKAESLADMQIDWHMIGHLQRNKIRRTLPLINCLHSADSERLLDSLQQEADRSDCQPSVLLEVNISGDVEKTGLSPSAALELVPRLNHWHCLRICGVMAMSGRVSDDAQARREFAAVRELRDRMREACPSDVDLPELSMGMSRDFAVAIEEGATIVRVGSALFEGLEL